MLHLPAVKRFVSTRGARVYRIPCDALPNLSGRVYLVLDAGPPTLVDAGTGEGRSIGQVLDGLDAVRRDFGEPVRLADVRRIVITHAHVDHFGGLWHLVRRIRAEHATAEVGVHELDRRFVSAYEERAAVANHALTCFLKRAGVEPARQADVIDAFGYRKGRVRSVPVDFTLGDGQVLDGLRFVHTPGHSPGHVCIAVDNLLLAGDHLLARTVPQQWPESTAAYTGLGHYFESLEKVRRLEGIDVALGGHEPPIPDVPKRIDEIIHTHQRRLDRMLEILAGSPEPLTIDEITDRMYTRQEGFQAMLALTDVGARVEHLDQRGHLAIANIDEVAGDDLPVYRYRPSAPEGGAPIGPLPRAAGLR
jgi:glyoxylase-like metal-dependent hydrolase (beta-lactamase superfamily II)